MFYVVGRQKTITLHEAANTLQGLHLGSNVTGYGRTNASWSCNKIKKVSKKRVFQDESSTQGKLPSIGITSSKTKLTNTSSTKVWSEKVSHRFIITSFEITALCQ